MTKHVLEKLAETNSDAEIWWDSSPLVYPSWKQETLAAAPDGMAGEWDEQLTRLYDPDEPAEMGFRKKHFATFLQAPESLAETLNHT